MIHLVDLWMPILVASVLVFIASAILWMASPLHKGDYKDPGDNELPLMDFIRSHNFAPGLYHIPWCNRGKDKSPEGLARMKGGPWAQLIVMPALPNFGRALGIWFVHLIVISTIIAYVMGHSGVGPKIEYMYIFRLAFVLGLLGYGGYAIPMSNWHALPWSQLPGRLVDAVIYAALTAGSFAWLWPEGGAMVDRIILP